MDKAGTSVRRWINENSIVFAVIIMFVLMAACIPYFFTINNLLSILMQVSVIGIAAIGLTFVIISAGNDLSVGSNMTMSAITAVNVMVALAKIMDMPLAVAIGLITGLVVGCVIGLLNGILVARVGCNAFIITIIMSMFVEGLALFLTQASSIRAPKEFRSIASGKILGIPSLVIILIALYIIAQFVLRRTIFGRQVYALGANFNAARLVGIKTVKMHVFIFVLGGLSAALAGTLMSARVGAATQAMGGYLFLDVMSAVIIGGTSLFGGKGNMVGTMLGVLILGMISNGFNLLGVEYNQTLIIKGAVILIAIIIEYAKNQFSSRRMLAPSAAETRISK